MLMWRVFLGGFVEDCDFLRCFMGKSCPEGACCWNSPCTVAACRAPKWLLPTL